MIFDTTGHSDITTDITTSKLSKHSNYKIVKWNMCHRKRFIGPPLRNNFRSAQRITFVSIEGYKRHMGQSSELSVLCTNAVQELILTRRYVTRFIGRCFPVHVQMQGMKKERENLQQYHLEVELNNDNRLLSHLKLFMKFSSSNSALFCPWATMNI